MEITQKIVREIKTEVGSKQWCAGECLTAGSPGKGKKSPWFVAFANFHGVNGSIMANFKPLAHKIPENWTKALTNQRELALAHSWGPKAEWEVALKGCGRAWPEGAEEARPQCTRPPMDKFEGAGLLFRFYNLSHSGLLLSPVYTDSQIFLFSPGLSVALQSTLADGHVSSPTGPSSLTWWTESITYPQSAGPPQGFPSPRPVSPSSPKRRKSRCVLDVSFLLAFHSQ